ncbi:hypothetical protein ACFWVC_37155 [Streptomyces sp. NPDC058691]
MAENSNCITVDIRLTPSGDQLLYETTYPAATSSLSRNDTG